MWNETFVSIIYKSPSGALLIEGGLSCCILFVVYPWVVSALSSASDFLKIIFLS